MEYGATYGCHMRDAEQPEGTDLGTWIKRARVRKGWTQERLMAEADISKSTANRWENGKGGGDPETIRRAVLALGLDPREAAVRIGLVTREEWDLPAPLEPMPDKLAEIADLLVDERIPKDAKASLLDVIGAAFTFWKKQLGVPTLSEPSAADREKGKPITSH